MTHSTGAASPPQDATPTAPDIDPGRRVIKRYSNRKLYDTQDSCYVTLLQIADMVRAGQEVQIIDNASKEDKTDLTLALIISEELKAMPRAIPISTLRMLIRSRGERIMGQLRHSPLGRLMPADGPPAPQCTAPAGQSPGQMASPTSESPYPASRAPAGGEANDRQSSGTVEAPKSTDGAAKDNAHCSAAAYDHTRTSFGAGTLRRTLESFQGTVDDRLRGLIPDSTATMHLRQEIERLQRRVAALEAQLQAAKAPAEGPSNGGRLGE